MTIQRPPSARPRVTLSTTQIRSIYPLNKLNPQALAELQKEMQLKHMRAGQVLFKYAEVPDNAYWVLDGALQLSDPKEQRIETVSPAHEEEAMPLPYIVPTGESAVSLVDSTVLCVKRAQLSAVLAQQNVKLFSDCAPSKTPIVQSSGELFREFEVLREEQKVRRRSHRPPTPEKPQIQPRSPGIQDTAEYQASRKNTQRKDYVAASKPRNATLLGTDRVHEAFRAFSNMPGHRQLPLGLQAECMLNCQVLEYADGDVIISQGDQAHSWYLVLNGECEVLFSDGRRQLRANYYRQGGSFGEDGLITGLPRNATVRAVGDVEVLHMGKAWFDKLLVPALLKKVVPEQLKHPPFNQAIWLDVRLPREKTKWSVSNSLEIPWPVIRAHPFTASSQKTCIAVCERGNKSQIIAYALRKHGFKAYYLEGGIEQVPTALRETRVFGGRPVEGGVIRLL